MSPDCDWGGQKKQGIVFRSHPFADAVTRPKRSGGHLVQNIRWCKLECFDTACLLPRRYSLPAHLFMRGLATLLSGLIPQPGSPQSFEKALTISRIGIDSVVRYM